MKDEELKKLVDEVAAASGYSGVDMGTMYGEFAFEVACRAVLAERVACEIRCARTPVLVDGHHAYTALKVQAMMMRAVSNVELSGGVAVRLSAGLERDGAVNDGHKKNSAPDASAVFKP